MSGLDEKLEHDPFPFIRDFITKKMQKSMSHIYQPVMLKTLLQHHGTVSVRQIAQSFLAHDESQIEYYEEITKRWPTQTLSKHGLIRRDGQTYHLTIDPDLLTDAQRDTLIHAYRVDTQRHMM